MYGSGAAGWVSISSHQEERVDSRLEIGNSYGPDGTITVHKFHDLDGDGIWDSEEPPLANVRIKLYVQTPNGDYRLLQAGETSGTGALVFRNLPPNHYRVIEVVPPGAIATTSVPPDVWLNPGESVVFGSSDSDDSPPDGSDGSRVGIGNAFVGKIVGVKFHDRNENGVRDPGEEGLPNVRIYLDLDGDGTRDPDEPSTLTSSDVAFTTADETGQFSFQDLKPGTYPVAEEAAAHMTQTSVPPVLTIQSGDVWVGRGGSVPIGSHQQERVKPQLEMGNSYGPDGTISGYKFHDLDGDGVWDSGEPPLADVTIKLYVLTPTGEYRLLQTAVTSGTGAFVFRNLPPNHYRLIEVLPPGAIATTLLPLDVMVNPGDSVVFGSDSGDSSGVGSAAGEGSSGWRNPHLPTDVNGDGKVAPLDALLGINELNKRRYSDDNSHLPPSPPSGMAYPMLDVNGDSFCTPIDVLQVINAINEQSTMARSSPEGEGLTSPVIGVESAQAGAPLADLSTRQTTSLSLSVNRHVGHPEPAGMTSVSPAPANMIWVGPLPPPKQHRWDFEDELKFDPSFAAELEETLDLILN